MGDKPRARDDNNTGPESVARDDHEAPPCMKKYGLADLLAKMTPENRHPEIDWGPSMGEEVW